MRDDKHQIGTEWLDLRTVSQYVRVSVRTVRSWIHSWLAPLPAVRVAGKTFVRRSELDAWLQRHRLQPLAVVDVDAIVREVLSEKKYGSQSSKTKGAQGLVRGHRPSRAAQDQSGRQP